MTAASCPKQVGSSDGEARNEVPLSTMPLRCVLRASEMTTVCSGVLDLPSRPSLSLSDVGGDGPSGSPSMPASPHPPDGIVQTCDADKNLPSKRGPSAPSEKLDETPLVAGLPVAGSIASCAGASETIPFPQQEPQGQKGRKHGDLASRLEVVLKPPDSRPAVCTNRVDLHAALDLLRLPLDEMHLPLVDLSALFPEAPEDYLVPITPAPTESGSLLASTARILPDQSFTSHVEASSASAAPVGQRQHPEECARRELLYAAKRFQRQRRLLLQQMRNRLLAALQQISDLQDAKEAAEIFLEELRQEVAVARAERQKAREALRDEAHQQLQHESQRSRVFFDPLPPPSIESLPHHPKVVVVGEASEEDALDTSDSPVAFEGSANVERLMQRYYATLIADVDQAAKEHARAHGSSNGDAGNPGTQEAPMDSGSTWGTFAPYYFDPFAVDQGVDVSRRGQQGTATGGPQLPAASSAGNGAPNGAISGQGAAALAARSHPMLSAAAEKVRGVAFCKSNRYWICTRMEHGKQQCRYFSVKHLGFECARREAILLRQQWKGDVNEEVLKALEEEKAAMDAAAAESGGSGLPTRSRGAGEIHSPSLRPAAPLTQIVSSPLKLPHVGAGTVGGPPPRKEKSGPIKRRRDALTRPLVIDRSGTMPRPPPEFDFASDSDFLTDNEEDREEEALAMNAALLAECSDRNARAAHLAKEEPIPEDDPEALLKRRRREIVANCFMGVTSTADALVLLSRRLTYSVKIPGISFHKGVESWLCTWKEPDSRTISRYFRCSRFGFRRGFKLSVFTLLLNAPRAAGMRAFLAIKEIKRRRRAARRGDLYNRQEPTIERPPSSDPSESFDRRQSLTSTQETRKGVDIAPDATGKPAQPVFSANLGSDPLTPVAQQAVSMLAKQNALMDSLSPSVESLGLSGSHAVAFGGGTAGGDDLGTANEPAAVASTHAPVPEATPKPIHSPEATHVSRDFSTLRQNPCAHKVPSATLVSTDDSSAIHLPH